MPPLPARPEFPASPVVQAARARLLAPIAEGPPETSISPTLPALGPPRLNLGAPPPDREDAPARTDPGQTDAEMEAT